MAPNRIELTTKQRLDFSTQGLKSAYEFAKREIVTHIKPESCLGATFNQIVLTTYSIIKLDEPACFQAVQSLARLSFELLVELKLLQTCESACEKYEKFTFVNRFRIATKILEYVEANPSPEVERMYQVELAFARDSMRRARVIRICKETWGVEPSPTGKLRTPDHWTKKDMAQRAKEVGLGEEYHAKYGLHSGSAHAGGTPIVNMSEDSLTDSYSIACYDARKYLLDAVRTMAFDLHLLPGDEFEERLRTEEQKIVRMWLAHERGSMN